MPLEWSSSLPLLTADLPGTGGFIKTTPEDFEVEEIPAYEPSGEGDHLYLWVQKRGIGADYFVRQIAKRLGIPADDIGTAGLKDRHAVTRQWISVPSGVEARLGALDGDGITLLKHARHVNKLKSGHLRGNRFRILIRDVVAPDALPYLLDRLQTFGIPNFYGPQRFGRDGETLQIGLELLHGKPVRVGGFLRRLGLSAVQSALFNRYVARRMADGLLRRVIAGDAMKKWPFGGIFNAVDLPAEQSRLESREIIPTGPMFGKKMFAVMDEAAERERANLDESGISPELFASQGKLLMGTRRYAFVYADELSGETIPEGIRVTFTLPAGSYATVLVRELTHSDGLASEDADE
ncbi:MAG: tRNA pseudouridine(13) synthase TruD [Planctomycetia bacterium]|nr:tRNA pseudouridine(13) synthase TruD [Planctomycetia bacterium]